jgi:hypothetical protein
MVGRSSPAPAQALAWPELLGWGRADAPTAGDGAGGALTAENGAGAAPMAGNGGRGRSRRRR